MENKIIIKRLEALRSEMKKRNIDAYIIPTNDFHGSEYVGDYFKCREYISGFTGSAGTVIVTPTKAGLWTDGRYFLQAEAQLKGTTVDLYKMGEVNVPNLFQFLDLELGKSATIGFDGRVISIDFVNMLKKFLYDRKLTLLYKEDLIDLIWKDRPALSCEKVIELDTIYSGEARKDKLTRIRKHFTIKGYDALVLTSLDDIAWTLNLRGADVECNPVVLSYAIIGMDYVNLYINKEVLNAEIIKNLKNDGVNILPYNQIYEDVKGFDKEDVIVLQNSKVNYSLYASINVLKQVNELNITTVYKACKNETEAKGAYFAHYKDAIAMIKFIYWLKTHIGKEEITEISAADKLESFRRMQPNFKGLSFATIAGFKEHGAIIHYSATKETDVPLRCESFLLLDSGGQYLEGTTDITRTIALGKLTKKEKEYYTLVLKGHLGLVNACFREGVSGGEIDILARQALYKNLLNYNHGTGHGVGSFLNVHEGPQNISNSLLRASYPLANGMITSDEPGIYIPNEFGVRIENLMICRELGKSEFGNFLCFDPLTLVPYEKDAIVKDLLNSDEIKELNDYHARVYNTMKNELTEEERAWLEEACKAI